MASIIAFDVNETLLDLAGLDEPLEELMGQSGLRPQWFALMLQLSFVGGLTEGYTDFRTAQEAALIMLAERHQRDLSPDAISAFVDRMEQLPAHPEVSSALERLRQGPLVVVALGNSPPAVIESQLANSGLRGFFDAVYSAGEVRRLKPAPQPYLLVAERHGVTTAEVRLVAAHSWDITGALTAGCAAAFVRRPGMVLSPIGPQPDIDAGDLDDAVDQILRRDV